MPTLNFLFTGVNGALMSLLTFCLGLLCGHWFALGRDKRHEWNAMIEPAERLLRFAEEGRIMMELVDPATMRRATDYLPAYRRRGFRLAWKNYKAAQCDVYEGPGPDAAIVPAKVAHLTQCAKRLLRYIRFR